MQPLDLASSPGLPRFCSSVFVYYTWKQKSVKKRGRPGNTYHVNDSGGREVDIGGALSINQLVCNSEFLTSEVKYCQSCEPQES